MQIQNMQQNHGNDRNHFHDEELSTQNTRPQHPEIKPGQSADDIAVIQGRRQSIREFRSQFEDARHRESTKSGTKLQEEARRRSHRSDKRRRSSLHDVPMGLLPPNMPYDPSSKSDLGGHTFKEKMSNEDKVLLKSIAKQIGSIVVQRPKETPANSPLNSPVANSPRSGGEVNNDSGRFDPNMADIVDDADIHEALHLSIGNGGSGSNLSAKREARESRAYQEQITLFKTRIAEKEQLIRDLKENMETLRQHRKDELLHFQQELESMRTRCRDWYERLMERVREMESAYHDKINAELSAKTRQMEQRLSEEKRVLKEQYEASMANNQIMANDDALRMELAKLQDKVEQYQGKYFDGEQKKIEITDQLEEVQREKYQMEEKMEQLEIENKKLQKELEVTAQQMREERMRSERDRDLDDKRDTPYSAGGGHNRRSTDEWNAMVQKLREDKETQETQYEEEFKEFERMANHKVVCDTVYCKREIISVVDSRCLCRSNWRSTTYNKSK